VNDLWQDYKGSGYDRGHMAAAGNHRHSQAAMDQTFVLSNISPQVGLTKAKTNLCLGQRSKNIR